MAGHAEHAPASSPEHGHDAASETAEVSAGVSEATLGPAVNLFNKAIEGFVPGSSSGGAKH